MAKVQSGLAAEEVVQMLDLKPHPEGGFYKETFRDQAGTGGRAHSTAIYYLLRGGEVSRWHRVDSAEVWHWYGGGTIRLSISQDDAAAGGQHILGGDLSAGERPQIVIPAHAWQMAEGIGAWTLVGCTVAPGFEFSRFELAPQGWSPGGETSA